MLEAHACHALPSERQTSMRAGLTDLSGISLVDAGKGLTPTRLAPMKRTRAAIMKKIVYVTLFCLISGLASAQTFYRWKDAQGATHYTLTPPEGRSSTSLEVSTGVTSEEPANTVATKAAPAAAAPATKATPKKTDTTKVATYQERCDQYRANLDMLKSGSQLTTKGEDGKLRAITKEDRTKMTATANEMLAACPPASGK